MVKLKDCKSKAITLSPGAEGRSEEINNNDLKTKEQIYTNNSTDYNVILRDTIIMSID